MPLLTLNHRPCMQARAMCASWPYQISSEAVAELIASDVGDPDYLVRLVLFGVRLQGSIPIGSLSSKTMKVVASK